MPDTSNVIYLYDGSYDGFLCCVFDSVYRRELPQDIRPCSPCGMWNRTRDTPNVCALPSLKKSGPKRNDW